METTGEREGFWLEYGVLCVVDCGRGFPVGGLDPDDLKRWFSAQAMVMVEDDQREVVVRTEVDSVPPGVMWGELDVVSGQVFVGSTEMLLEQPIDPENPGEGLVVRVPPGPYRVGIVTEGAHRYVVYLEAVEALTGSLGGNLSDLQHTVPGTVAPGGAPRSAPILSQLTLTAARLGAWLKEAGQVLRLGEGLSLPVRLTGAEIGPVLSDRLPEDVRGFLERRSWTFGEEGTSDDVRYVHSGNERLVLRVGLRDGEVVDACLASPLPTSNQDRDEVLALLAASYLAGPTEGMSVRAVPAASASPIEERAEPVLEWSAEKLTIRLSRPELTRPLVRVTFFDGPQPVEQSEVRPLYLREGAWLYEVWLVGPREGLSVAQVHLV